MPANHGSIVMGNCISLVTMIALLTLRHAQDATNPDKYMIAQQRAAKENINPLNCVGLAHFASLGVSIAGAALMAMNMRRRSS